MTENSSVSVAENTEAKRYEVSVDGVLAGFATYRDRDGERIVLHSEVFPEFEGHGLAGRLARDALDDIRGRGWQVVPRCPFFAAYIRKHPEYAEMVAK
jgi:hypothetical protein